MLRLSDARALHCALQAKLALMLAFVEIADGALILIANERAPTSLMGRELGSVHPEVELRVGPQKGSDLLGVHLVHIQCICLKRWVCSFESGLHLVPRKCPLLCSRRLTQGQQNSHGGRSADSAKQ